MRRVFKIIIGFVVVFGLIVYWLISRLTDSYSPTHQKVELVSPENEKLYIKSENLGITGDHQLTIITTQDSENFEVDSTRQIIFKGLEPFLYRSSNDTLFLILSHKSEMPVNFKSSWTIIQKEVDNQTKRNLRRNTEYKGI